MPIQAIELQGLVNHPLPGGGDSTEALLVEDGCHHKMEVLPASPLEAGVTITVQDTEPLQATWRTGLVEDLSKVGMGNNNHTEAYTIPKTPAAGLTPKVRMVDTISKLRVVDMVSHRSLRRATILTGNKGDMILSVLPEDRMHKRYHFFSRYPITFSQCNLSKEFHLFQQ